MNVFSFTFLRFLLMISAGVVAFYTLKPIVQGALAPNGVAIETVRDEFPGKRLIQLDYRLEQMPSDSIHSGHYAISTFYVQGHKKLVDVFEQEDSKIAIVDSRLDIGYYYEWGYIFLGLCISFILVTWLARRQESRS